ncbi:hypothetical protein [Streptomyces hypolithicus]
MGENVPVRCPVCRRTHSFEAPVFPCACGEPLAPPLSRGATPERITHRTWTDAWVTVRCGACGRQDQWPQPELGCACGAVLRIPVRPVPRSPAQGPDRRSTSTSASTPTPTPEPAPGQAYGPAGPVQGRARHQPGHEPTAPARPGPTPGPASAHPPGNSASATGPLPDAAAAPRPRFRPMTIRTARDAVTAAALYLKWLGFRDIMQSPERPASGIDLRAPGLVAQVDPTTRPANLRDVECLWLNGLSASGIGVFFSLAGYADDARARADTLGVPLFVMDLTGTPQPVNRPAGDLISTGA